MLSVRLLGAWMCVLCTCARGPVGVCAVCSYVCGVFAVYACVHVCVGALCVASHGGRGSG